jgi:hypothetical protein
MEYDEGKSEATDLVDAPNLGTGPDVFRNLSRYFINTRFVLGRPEDIETVFTSVRPSVQYTDSGFLPQPGRRPQVQFVNENRDAFGTPTAYEHLASALVSDTELISYYS